MAYVEDSVSRIRQLLRDVRARVEAFVKDHPQLAGRGITVEFTIYDEKGESSTATIHVGVRDTPLIALA
jgi:hypothetical protein